MFVQFRYFARVIGNGPTHTLLKTRARQITFDAAVGDAASPHSLARFSLDAGPLRDGVYLGRDADGVFVQTGSGVLYFTNAPYAGGQKTAQACAYGLAGFAPGAMIATPDGAQAVETLLPGDLVLTADRGAEPVRWLFSRTVEPGLAGHDAATIRIAAGALGDGLPVRDLRVAADHALLIDGQLIQASALVNGVTVVREPIPADPLRFFHIELDRYGMVLANGVAAETAVDNPGSRLFDNWRDHPATEAARPPVDAPQRVKSARQVPSTLKMRLRERAT